MPSSEEGFTDNTIDNPKNETWKVVDTDLGVIIEKDKYEIDKEDNKNQGEQEERGFTLDQIIDKNSPWRRMKKQILTEPNPPLQDYVKPMYLIIKKKLVQDDEVGIFAKFKEMLATFQVSI